MNASLRYGATAKVELELDADAQLASNRPPPSLDPDSFRRAIEAALAEPLGFPPLVEAIVPGDRVAVALEAGVNGAEHVVAGLVKALAQRGVDADHVTVVRTQTDADADRIDPRAALAAPHAGEVVLETHDARERGHLAMLSVDDDNQPIYLNRTLCDADVVVTIGRMRTRSMHDYLGRYGALLPSFSDEATINGIRNQLARSFAPGGKPAGRGRIDQTGRQLGAQFTVQIVPSLEGEPAQVLGGAFDAVFDRGEQSCGDAWSFEPPFAASLVVAGIVGGATDQTWDALSRAVAVAAKWCEDDGAIVVCSELASPPGVGVRRLAASEDPQDVLRWLRKNAPADAGAATALAAALSERRVYLLSRLDDETVEELGITPLVDGGEISRLARAHDACLLLAGAQYIVGPLSPEPVGPARRRTERRR